MRREVLSRLAPRPRRASDIERSKDRIHAAALELLARYGYKGVSLQQIADAVGLHKSSLFHHCRGKLELAKEVFEAVMARVALRVRPREHDEPARLETLLAVTDDLADHFAAEPGAARLILSVMIAPRETPSPARAPSQPRRDAPARTSCACCCSGRSLRAERKRACRAGFPAVHARRLAV